MLLLQAWAAKQGTLLNAQSPPPCFENTKMCPFCIGGVPFLTFNDVRFHIRTNVKYACAALDIVHIN